MSEDLKKTTDNITTENVENVEVLEVTPTVEKKSTNNKKI